MIKSLFLPILMAIILLPWFMLQMHQSMNADLAWLVIGAQRLLSGGTMINDVYDPNPPISFLLYMPPVLFGKMTGIPVWTATFFYSALLVLLSTLAVHSILKGWTFIKQGDRAVLIGAYLIANTVLTSVNFGQRDQIAVLGLAPFLLLQISMTMNFPFPKRLQWLVLPLGALCAVIKPHYGLLPVAVLLVRAAVQRRRTIIFDHDFMALAAAVIAYGTLTYTLFPDYGRDILPAAIDLYLPMIDPAVFSNARLYGGLLIVCFAITAGAPIDKTQKYLGFSLFTAALLALIGYVAQLKGMPYQLVPAQVFALSGISILIYGGLQFLYPKRDLWAIPLIGAYLLALWYTPLKPDFPKHDDYKNFEISKRIEACGTNCSFFMYNENMAIIHPTAIYTGATHGSRFPSYWFMPKIAESDGKLTQAQRDVYRQKYAGLIAEDLERYKPDILFICQNCDEGMPFAFESFASVSAEFVEEWKNYASQDTITVNRRDYYKGTRADFDHLLEYKVYRRVGTP